MKLSSWVMKCLQANNQAKRAPMTLKLNSPSIMDVQMPKLFKN